MKSYILAGAAALALALPAAAQEMAVASDGDVYVISPQQKPIYDAWPLERRTVFDAWPDNYKVYYWTLTPEQRNGWWVLTDEQRAKVYAMTPQQRTAAWAAIANQMGSGGSASATATAATRTGNINWVSNAMVQNIAMDQATGEVPICNAGQTDNCINAWEAGKRGPGVTRPLDHWPGKPASEM